MASQSLRPVVDRLIPGGLDPWLREQRARGNSGQTIAERIAAITHITVTRQTVLKWCDELEIEAAS
jgi:DNA-directed RNA polymerase specialized sigma54-like protein